MTKIKSSTTPIGGNTIHTLSAGTPGNRPVLLLHGKAFQAATWKELGTLELLAENGCFAVALDLPGWGDSPAGDFEAGEIVQGVIDAFQLEKPTLLGPSMGGKIALEFCLEHAGLLGGLVLIGAVGVEENRARLQELPGKTLIIWGENDHIADPANGLLLNREIAGSQLVSIPNTKHACYMENPKEFHRRLINFISASE